MKKLDFVIIGLTIIILLFLGIIFIENNKIKEENIVIEVIVQNETIYSISLEEDGEFVVQCKDNILTLSKNNEVIITKKIESKNFKNCFQIANKKVTMNEASCSGKDCTKMYISQTHLIPIICTNGIVLNPIGQEKEIDVIV